MPRGTRSSSPPPAASRPPSTPRASAPTPTAARRAPARIADALAALLVRVLDSGKPVALVCHASAALLAAMRPDGGSAVAGYRLTGFTNAEETQAGLAERAPWLLQDRLVSAGADFRAGEAWSVRSAGPPRGVRDSDMPVAVPGGLGRRHRRRSSLIKRRPADRTSAVVLFRRSRYTCPDFISAMCSAPDVNARPDEALLGSLQPIPLVRRSWRVVGSGAGGLSRSARMDCVA